MAKREEVLKNVSYKSKSWADQPVIDESLFREYDLRSAVKPLSKGGMEIKAALNEDGMRILGQAYGTYIQRSMNERKVVVGNDYRSYERGMFFSFVTGLMSTGVDVVDIGLAITPVLYYAQYNLNLKAGAMVTASHNESGWAGLKLATGLSKTFEPEHIVVFKDLVYNGEFIKGRGSYTRLYDIKKDYIKDIVTDYKKLIGKRKLKVVVSTANGTASEFLPDLLEKMGFEVIRVFCDLDWDFPNFNPNPENVKFMSALGEAVRNNKADLGVAGDGDGDRFGVCNEKGEPIYSDRAGLFIARFISSKVQNRTFVIDVKSTGAYALDPILKASNNNVEFCKTGHSYVKAAARKFNAISAFEKSGHFFLRDEFGKGYDDACRSAAMFCTVLSNYKEKLSELIDMQPKSFQSPTMEPHVKDDIVKYEIVEKVGNELLAMHKAGKTFAGKKIKEIITVNGYRVVLEDGSWGLVRASSNLPVLVICIESLTSKKLVYEIFDEIQSHLEKHGVKKEHYDQLLPPYKGE